MFYAEEHHYSFFLAATFLNELSMAPALHPALTPANE